MKPWPPALTAYSATIFPEEELEELLLELDDELELLEDELLEDELLEDELLEDELLEELEVVGVSRCWLPPQAVRRLKLRISAKAGRIIVLEIMMLPLSCGVEMTDYCIIYMIKQS